jgi:signal transduction histidine kinase
MNAKPIPRPQAGLFLIISYLLWASVSLRWMNELVEAQHPQTVLVGGMLLLYGILLGLEPWLTGRVSWRSHLYLGVQTLLAFGAIYFYYQLDFFAILLLPVAGQAAFLFPRRTAAAWVAILMVLNVIGQINQFGWPEALTFILLYSAALIFVTAFSARTIQAEQARARAESLLVELQQANHRLQELAGQAEELAIARERNRLACDLHDSVAQTLYGLTLQSEAASRQLAAGKTERVAEYLREIRQSTLQTLGETRLLIFELRPPILEEIGLSAALRARLDAVETRSGLMVKADLEDIGRLPPSTEVGLYRIAQEALNNILKHAQAKSVQVALHRQPGSIQLQICDDGVGLDDLQAGDSPVSPGGLGLKGMAERAEQIGGKLELSGFSGQGVKIKIEVPA